VQNSRVVLSTFDPIQAPLKVSTGVVRFWAPGVILSVEGGFHESVATRHVDRVGWRGRARWSGTAGDVAMKIRGFRTRKPEHRKE
jgi:hypothetical protein